jgi:hypothetical protein
MALKICTIGCGNHSALVHGPSYMKYVNIRPDTILAACCDFNEERALTYKESFGFQRYYTDMVQMLETEKPDAVCIIVPEQFICQTTISVMEMGYPVLLEKPPGLNKEETLRMIAVAEKTGVINQVAFNRRHIPLINKLKEEMNKYSKDTIQSIFYEFYRFGRTDTAFETTAIHGIDVVKNIIGSDYKEVRFTYQEMPHLGKNVANMLLDCKFENGIVARLNFCPCAGVIVDRACINALDHTFFLQTPIWNGFDTPGKLTHIKEGKLESEISGLDLNCGKEMFETNGFYDENYLFFENIRSGKKCEDDIKSAFQAVEIAELIKMRAAYYEKCNF